MRLIITVAIACVLIGTVWLIIAAVLGTLAAATVSGYAGM